MAAPLLLPGAAASEATPGAPSSTLLLLLRVLALQLSAAEVNNCLRVVSGEAGEEGCGTGAAWAAARSCCSCCTAPGCGAGQNRDTSEASASTGAPVGTCSIGSSGDRTGHRAQRSPTAVRQTDSPRHRRPAMPPCGPAAMATYSQSPPSRLLLAAAAVVPTPCTHDSPPHLSHNSSSWPPLEDHARAAAWLLPHSGTSPAPAGRCRRKASSWGTGPAHVPGWQTSPAARPPAAD